MAVLDAIENRLMDAVLGVLQGIGSPPSGWLTSNPAPVVAEGIPANALSVTAAPLLFVDCAGTLPQQPEAAVGGHWLRVSFSIYALARTTREACALKADVLRALFAAEQSFTQQFAALPVLGAFGWRTDYVKSGLACAQQDVSFDVYISHSAP